MCGRFVLAGPGEALQRLFGLAPVPGVAPRWNVAPGGPVLAVRAAADGSGAGAFLPSWGFVPAWSAERPPGGGIVNARVEGVGQKSSFRDAWRNRRCLLPAEGFYEWTKGRPKRPWLFRVEGGAPFALAGLWERRGPPGEGGLETVAILTTEANELVGRVHDRMPLIVATEDHARWLDPGADAADLLRPFPAGRMDAYPVRPLVNSAAAEGPECVEPDGEAAPPPVQGRLF